MATFSKILVATDFSESSADAVRVAVDLSKTYVATLSIVHVLEPYLYMKAEGYPFSSPEQIKKLLRAQAQSLAQAERDAKAAGASAVDSTQLEGFAAEEIVAFAEKGGYDLIVVANRGRTGLSRALLGSVAEKVARTAPCALLVVRERGAASAAGKA